MKLNFDHNHDAVLVFSSGNYILGKGIGQKNQKTIGEICFNTAMTGYQEIITDPSYSQQIITFTFPHIGNVGVNENDNQSKGILCNGIIIRERISNPSNYRAQHHLDKWLEENQRTGICGVDTRAITNYIREKGVQNVVIYYGQEGEQVDVEALIALAKDKPTLKGMELTKEASTQGTFTWDKGIFNLDLDKFDTPKTQHDIIVVDFGVKDNIPSELANVGLNPIVVSGQESFEAIMEHNPKGIFFSNGPGDPHATSGYAVPLIQKLIDTGLPIFGICMGHQLLSIASNLETVKMHQGHRGANHPVKNLERGTVEITSQNHGFCVSDKNIPDNVEITHVSLFDNTIEGIRRTDRPVFSVQYHPESAPGPNDSKYLFKQFRNLIDQVQQA